MQSVAPRRPQQLPYSGPKPRLEGILRLRVVALIWVHKQREAPECLLDLAGNSFGRDTQHCVRISLCGHPLHAAEAASEDTALLHRNNGGTP